MIRYESGRQMGETHSEETIKTQGYGRMPVF